MLRAESERKVRSSSESEWTVLNREAAVVQSPAPRAGLCHSLPPSLVIPTMVNAHFNKSGHQNRFHSRIRGISLSANERPRLGATFRVFSEKYGILRTPAVATILLDLRLAVSTSQTADSQGNLSD